MDTHFKCGRQLAAWLCLGARAVVAAGKNKTDRLSRWAQSVAERRGYWKAVVAVAAGAFEEIISESCGLLCAPNNAQAMANAVRELFSRGTDVIGRQARQHVERHYAWDTVVDSLLGHYHAVLGNQWPLAANG